MLSKGKVSPSHLSSVASVNSAYSSGTFSISGTATRGALDIRIPGPSKHLMGAK